MEKVDLIVSLAGATLGFLITAMTFIIKFCKSAKAKKIAEQSIKIGNILLPYIEQAEAFVNFNGQEKKQFVMTKANQYAIDNRINFDTEAVSEKVEELIVLTKHVNACNSELGRQNIPNINLYNSKGEYNNG